VTTVEASVWIAQTPPSLNAVGGRGGPVVFHRFKKRWQADLEVLLWAERFPRGLARVEAHFELRFPTRRRRDTGNYQSLLEKALGDALQAGGWLADDTPDHFAVTGLSFDEHPGPMRTTVHLKGLLP